MTNLGNRIVVLIDMDCFFCQVETRLEPKYSGQPLAVVQYNLWRTGGIIAVNYEAREFGVTRHMRSEEAKEKCPDIILATVPPLRGKADTSRYRSAGREVIDVLKKHCSMVERASVDEAYLDITQIVDEKLAKETIEPADMLNKLSNTYVVGHSEVDVNNEEQRKEGLKTWLSESSEDPQIQRLAIAASLVEDMRRDIFETTSFKCSAGISFNKILAKLACGLHKPNRQTILPASSVPDLFGGLPVKKVRHLGGKLGDIVIDLLKCNVMADLLPFSLQHLQSRFDDKTGLWLYNIARGIDNEPVTPRLVSKSIGACKRFPGKQVITDIDVLKHWLGELSAEVCERLEQDLEENERRASLLTLSYHFYQNKSLINQSKSLALNSYKPEKMAEQCINIVVKATQLQSITFLGLSAAKFVKAKGSENFMNFFKAGPSDKSMCTASSSANTTLEDSKRMDEETEQVIDNAVNNGSEAKDSKEFNKNFFEKKSASKKTKAVTPVGKPKVNRKSSPCSSIQRSLKSDNFKKSFFMNILKDKKPQAEETIVKVESPESDDENLAEPLEDDRPMSESLDMFDDGDGGDENVENVPTASVSKKSDVKVEQQESSSAGPSNATVELQEIFPDLNDIDPEIVKMLPLHLQQEAKKYLQVSKELPKNAETKKVIKSKETTSINKTSKEKVATKSKSTINYKPKNIQNFFIKTNSNSDSNNNFRKCTECGQMILIDKFDEHSDYHVAINLQKEISRTSSVDESRKRKGSLDSPGNCKKRLSGEIATTS